MAGMLQRAIASIGLGAVITVGTVTVVHADPVPGNEAWAPESWGGFEKTEPDTPWEAPAEDRVLGDEGARVGPGGTAAAAPGLGEQPYYSFQEFPLARDTVAKVNLANGNLLVTANDSQVAVPGFGLRHDRFYNGLATEQGAFGGGWSSSNTAPDVGLEVDGATVTLHGPNGIRPVFTADAKGTYDRPAGLNATLTQESTTGHFAWKLSWDRTGEVWWFSSNERLHRVEDRNGVGSTFAYNASGDMVQNFHDNGRAIRMHVNTAGQIDTLEDSPGRHTDYGYDAQDRLDEVIAPDGATSTYTYDGVGRLATITVPMTDSTSTTVEFGYDSEHRVTSVTQETTSPTWGAGADAVTEFTYGTGTTEVTDANDGVTEYLFDAGGIAKNVIDQLGNDRGTTYSPNYDVASSTDALGAGGVAGYTTNYTFDGNANTTSAELPTGAAASAVYTAGPDCSSTGGTAFQVKCATDASGNQTTYSYDANGNLTEQENTTAGTAEFTYTYETDGSICGGLEGQICTATDGNGNTTTYSYDSDGDLIEVAPPAPMGPTTYTHDALGRVLTVTDGNGDTTSYTWDVRDRLIETEYDGGATVTNSYHPNGLTEAVTDSAGYTKTSVYDAQGRLTEQTGPTGGDQQFAYDLLGNQTQYVAPYGTTAYAYNAANQLTSITQPGGTCPSSAAGAGCIQFEYNANGAETKRTLPGGAVIDRTLDNSGRLTRVTGTNGAGTVAVDVAYSYAHSTEGDVDEIQTRTSHREQGIPAGAVTAYTYDAYERLAAATETAGGSTNASWAYGYDAAGNRTEQTLAGDTGQTAGTTGYTLNSANQITATTADTATWSYDGAGNQLANGITGIATGYGDRLQTTSIDGQSQGYFAGGNTERLTGGASSYLASPMGLQQAATSAETQRFVRTPTGEAIAWNNGASTNGYFITDNLGSVLGLFAHDGSWLGGYSYSPYGEDRGQGTNAIVNLNQLRYIGELRDSTGLYKLGARFYDPGLGRFTQSDPTGQEANAYAYASGNPISRADPSGQRTSFAVALDVLEGLLAGQDLYTVLNTRVSSAEALGIITGGVLGTACAAATALAAAASLGAGVLVVGFACAALTTQISAAVVNIFDV